MSLTAGRYDLVVNPTAGRGRARRILPTVLAVLRRTLPGALVSVIEAVDPAHAEAACRDAAAEADALLVMGGDGMAHLGLNACADTGVPLGVLPAGTATDGPQINAKFLASEYLGSSIVNFFEAEDGHVIEMEHHLSLGAPQTFEIRQDYLLTWNPEQAIVFGREAL